MSTELRREAELRERERLALRKKELDFARDLRSLSSRPEGRRLLRRLLADADLFNPAWTPGEAGAYQAGKRAQGLMLWRVVRRALSAADAFGLLLPHTGETAEEAAPL